MTYVVVGAGPAGVVAAETLRKADADAEIVLIGNEPEPPYSRMAIPYYLTGKIEEDGTYLRKTDGHYDDRNIGYRQALVESVDPGAGKLTLAGGDSLAFDKLLVATGATPIAPPSTAWTCPACTTAGRFRTRARSSVSRTRAPMSS